MSVFTIAVNDTSLWLIVLVPILIVYIALLASSAVIQVRDM